MPRRRFLHGITLAGAAASTGIPILGDLAKPPYKGPNIIIVRFGGGVRRRETINPEHTYSPYLCHELTKRGVLFKNTEIDYFYRGEKGKEEVETSHGQGTLYILTGKYERFKDVGNKFLGQRFESSVPTVFEYLRRQYDVPEHQTLIINGEDRTDEEFYSFSNHHLFGANFRSNVLSLYRFKTHLLRRQIEAGKWEGKEAENKRKELAKLEGLDYRTGGQDSQGAEITSFWERWRQYYGETGLVNPRGDRLLTELSLRALKELRPKLMMINYNDPDYVHWGYMSHYTRGISVIDEGLRQLVAAVEADPEYRDNTIFAIVPDCGRDTNPYADVPCQHHFGSRSSHEIFALFFGPGIDQGIVVDKRVDQISIAATIGQFTGAKAEFAEGPVLEQVFA
jgi:hypothetical protein